LEALPDWPRLLSTDEAARYLGVSRETFEAEVKRGLWPKGIPRGKLNGKMTWDRSALDRRVDLISGYTAGGIQNAPEVEDGFARRRREAASRRQSGAKA
jgi:hypothetical protein